MLYVANDAILNKIWEMLGMLKRFESVACTVQDFCVLVAIWLELVLHNNLAWIDIKNKWISSLKEWKNNWISKNNIRVSICLCIYLSVETIGGTNEPSIIKDALL